MIRYQCTCGEEMLLVCSPALDLTRGVARVCTRCGEELVILLIAVRKEKLKDYLLKRRLKNET